MTVQFACLTDPPLQFEKGPPQHSTTGSDKELVLTENAAEESSSSFKNSLHRSVRLMRASMHSSRSMTTDKAKTFCGLLGKSWWRMGEQHNEKYTEYRVKPSQEGLLHVFSKFLEQHMDINDEMFLFVVNAI